MKKSMGTALGLLGFVGTASLGLGCDGEATAPPDAASLDAASDARTDAPSVGCPGCFSFVGGRVFDGTEVRAATVVVEGEQVRDVVPGLDARVTAGETLDVSGMTVLPGLLDMHVHTSASAGPLGYRSPTDKPENHLKAMLRTGVTSYLDLGTSAQLIFTYRQRQRSGRLLSPRIFAAGPLFTAPGSHPCREGRPPGDFCALIDRPADVEAAFAPVARHEPDVIKAVVESGTAFRPLPRMDGETLAALIRRADEADRPVVVHVSESEDVAVALDAGARIFAHMPSADALPAAVVERLAREDAVIIPTLAVFDSLYRIAADDRPELADAALERDVDPGVIDALQDPALVGFMRSPEYRDWARTRLETARRNFQRCLEAGVRMVAGTDAGNPGVFFGRAMHRELELYVREGMAPIDALATATGQAAELLGREDLGRIAPGARADLLVVRGDATESVDALSKVAHVVRAGEKLDRDSLALTEERSLLQHPASGQRRDEGCLATRECEGDLACRWDARCSATCIADGDCERGAICMRAGAGPAACVEGDGCDLLAQSCENGAACLWAGHGSTFCWSAGEGTAGDECDPFRNPCAPGYVCNSGAAPQCEKLCDPSKDEPDCPEGRRCVSVEEHAGLPAGHCR